MHYASPFSFLSFVFPLLFFALFLFSLFLFFFSFLLILFFSLYRGTNLLGLLYFIPVSPWALLYFLQVVRLLRVGTPIVRLVKRTYSWNVQNVKLAICWTLLHPQNNAIVSKIMKVCDGKNNTERIYYELNTRRRKEREKSDLTVYLSLNSNIPGDTH